MCALNKHLGLAEHTKNAFELFVIKWYIYIYMCDCE